MENILPVINLEKLQEAANEAALKGAISVINDFYNSYESPYKKAIREGLAGKGTSYAFDIPDIIGTLNDSFAKEIDTIANTAIAKSFIPMVKDFFTRVEGDIKLSDILKKFIEESGSEDPDEFDVSVEKHNSYDWIEVKISCNADFYDFTLHEDLDSRNEPVKKYKLLGLPRGSEKYGKTMKLAVEGGVTLEMPFTTDILKDKFMSYLASLIISSSVITIDTRNFDEEWFPNNHCHCD